MAKSNQTASVEHPAMLRRDAEVNAQGSLAVLSRKEMERLNAHSSGDLRKLMRDCMLAVLNTGNKTDDVRKILHTFDDFGVDVRQQDKGLTISLRNAPDSAFIGQHLIRGIQEHLLAVLRDVVYVKHEIEDRYDRYDSATITDAVFQILRNAGAIQPSRDPRIVVCWGGHSISSVEFEYCRDVGHALGLRGLDICTGCGMGAMEGPMEGASSGHAKQRIQDPRFIGITEPGIIAAEAPNPIVSELIIMPDIEKRLEAFLRLGHAIIVFPGGAGTAEEILCLLGVLMQPSNRGQLMRVVFTGPESSRKYFETMNSFVEATLGRSATDLYQIIIGNPKLVAEMIADGMQLVPQVRAQRKDAHYFSWQIDIPYSFQKPFDPTHEAMAELNLDLGQPRHDLAATLRRLFSGVVAGNVKNGGIQRIRERGPFKISSGSPELMRRLDELLRSFVADGRMKLPDSKPYQPCYEVVRD